MKVFLAALFCFTNLALAAEPAAPAVVPRANKNTVKARPAREAEVVPAAPAPVPPPPLPAPERNKAENWYFNLGLGYAHPKYNASLESAIKSAKAVSGYTRTSVGIDLGFYWPVNMHQTAIGLAIFGVSDTHSLNGYDITISQSALAFSTIHYFGEHIGDGFFLRGDIGAGSSTADIKLPSGLRVTGRSETGFVAQGGLGYSFPLSPETRLALGGYYSHFALKENKANNISILVSALF